MLNKNTSLISAQNYIRKNYSLLSREEIINQLMKYTRLSSKNIETVFDEVITEKYIEGKDKRQLDSYRRYKNRNRETFKFDTSRLWREI